MVSKRLEELVDYCFQMAGQLIEKEGEFYPFGAAMDIYGSMTAMNAWTGEKSPRGMEVYLRTEVMLRAQLMKGNIIAFAIVNRFVMPKPVLVPGVAIRVKCLDSAWDISTTYRISNGTVEFAPCTPTKPRPPCGTMIMKGQRLRADLAKLFGRK